MHAFLKIAIAASALLQLLVSTAQAVSHISTNTMDYTCTVTSNGKTFTSKPVKDGSYSADSSAPIELSGNAVPCTCGRVPKSCVWFRAAYSDGANQGIFYAQCVKTIEQGTPYYGCCDSGYWRFVQGGTNNVLKCN